MGTSYLPHHITRGLQTGCCDPQVDRTAVIVTYSEVDSGFGQDLPASCIKWSGKGKRNIPGWEMRGSFCFQGVI